MRNPNIPYDQQQHQVKYLKANMCQSRVQVVWRGLPAETTGDNLPKQSSRSALTHIFSPLSEAELAVLWESQSLVGSTREDHERWTGHTGYARRHMTMRMRS